MTKSYDLSIKEYNELNDLYSLALEENNQIVLKDSDEINVIKTVGGLCNTNIKQKIEWSQTYKGKDKHRDKFIKNMMSIYKEAAKTNDKEKLEQFFLESVLEINKVSQLQEDLQTKKKEIEQFANFMTGAAKEIKDMTELKSDMNGFEAPSLDSLQIALQRLRRIIDPE